MESCAISWIAAAGQIQRRFHSFWLSRISSRRLLSTALGFREAGFPAPLRSEQPFLEAMLHILLVPALLSAEGWFPRAVFRPSR